MPDQLGKKLMTIGMFSRASLLTVRALRNYHRSGLLVPAEIDPETGYRAYDPGQLADAAVIGRLRSLDVSLEDVATVMASRDPDVTAKVLRQHLDLMESRLIETQRIVDQLLVGQTEPGTFTPPRIEVVPHTYVATVTETISRHDYTAFLEPAFDRLLATVGSLGSPLTGPPGALYPPEPNEQEEVTAYVPLAEPLALRSGGIGTGIEIGELPQRTVATTTHIGSYDDIGDAYMQLGRWVALNATTLSEPGREIYERSHHESDDPTTFITHIQWPIEAGSPSTSSPTTSSSST